MNFRSESFFRVGGAIVVGLVLIGGALVFDDRENSERAPVAAIAISRGDVRALQPTTDSDGDGLPDWEEELRGTDPMRKTTITDPEIPEGEKYIPASTVTDRFAEVFLEDLVRTSAGRTLSPEEEAALLERSAAKLEATASEPLLTQADIHIVAANTLTDHRTYGNAVGGILIDRSIDNENELILLHDALVSGDTSALSELEAVSTAYAGMVADLIALPTPSAFAREHVALVNVLIQARTNARAMSNAFADPLAALVRARRYEQDATALYYALDSIRVLLESRDITYTNSEPGIVLFSFRP